MNISLKEFESVIDNSIVNRGSEYFANQAVSGLRQVKTDQWAASVEGTEQYKVGVGLRDDIVVDYSCSCPYDLGPVCKHVVAVLYELRARKYGGEKEAGDSKRSRGARRPHIRSSRGPLFVGSREAATRIVSKRYEAL